MLWSCSQKYLSFSRPFSLNLGSIIPFHSTASNYAMSRALKKRNNLRKEQKRREAADRMPSVVLGTRPGEEAKWDSCYLRKVLIDVDQLTSDTEMALTKLPVGTVDLPQTMNFGIGETEKHMLFHNLPILSTQSSDGFVIKNREEAQAAARREAHAQAKELQKANAFAKLVDMRNANAGGIAYENRKRIISAFSTPQNPFDSGRSEVQVALLTYKIRNLWNHLKSFRKDIGNRRGLRKLVHHRAKILRYLKGVDHDRYETILEQLALEPESVEGELVM